jgi:hypothetical protein
VSRGQRVARGTAIAGGVCLFLLGILHDVMGLASLRRAIARGEIAPRLAASHTVNWLMSGAALSLLGLIVVLAAWQLEAAGRLARWVLALIGGFLVLAGVGAFYWQPRPPVLVFAVLGLMVSAPLVARRAAE